MMNCSRKHVKACDSKSKRIRTDNHSSLSICDAIEELPAVEMGLEEASDPELLPELEGSAGSEETTSCALDSGLELAVAFFLRPSVMDIPNVFARLAKVPAADGPALELELAASRSLLLSPD